LATGNHRESSTKDKEKKDDVKDLLGRLNLKEEDAADEFV
jgi:hypothetical protein